MNNKRQEQAIVAADHLVGNLLFNLKALPIIAGRLPVEAMPDTPAATIYGVMCELFRDPGKQLSAGAIEAELKHRNLDFGYIDDLQKRILPEDIKALDEYVTAINDAAGLRRTEVIAGQMQAACRKGETSSEAVIADALQKLTSMSDPVSGPVLIDASAAELMERVDSWRKGEVPDGLKTHFVDLDRLISLRKGELITLAGRPSMGKSALAFQAAINVARQLKHDNEEGVIVIFSAEMNTESVSVRLACALAGVNSHRIRRGTAEDFEYTKFNRALEELQTLPIYIDDSASPTTEQIFFRTAMLNAQRSVKLVIFDFIELSGNVDASEELRIGGVAKALKGIAKTIDVPVIALSQLNRRVDERSDKLPVLSDLRYSGNIEAVSDVVIFLMRPEYYFSRGERSAYTLKPNHKEGVAYAIISKQRNGPIGTVALSFVEKYAKFGDLQQ